jgi:hypothetical protein
MTSDRQAWIERFARVGFAVKGLLYLLIGGLTLQVALGVRGRLTDLPGAMAVLLGAPAGQWCVAVLAFGLGLYAAWRFIEAAANTSREKGGRGIASRAQSAVSGAIYAALAADAATLAFAGASLRDGNRLPAMITTSELTRGAAILAALLFIGYGAWQLVRAFRRSISGSLNLSRVRRDSGPWAVRISRAGIAGRAVVLLAMGLVLLRRSTISAQAAANTTTADSLRLIGALPTGRWGLLFVAAGLIAFGVFQLVQARYRDISPP